MSLGLWSLSQVLTVAMGTLVFFCCFGFSLWKAISAAQASLYWHIALVFIWLGVVIAAIAGSRAEVWPFMLNSGYAMLCAGMLMTLCGMMHLALRQISLHLERRRYPGSPHGTRWAEVRRLWTA